MKKTRKVKALTALCLSLMMALPVYAASRIIVDPDFGDLRHNLFDQPYYNRSGVLEQPDTLSKRSGFDWIYTNPDFYLDVNTFNPNKPVPPLPYHGWKTTDT
ncbi:MAG: hypothetical protein K2P98_06715, partial [Neisseriaceae bacterium]|nr:hypothetical protein [Neisseriaceae bacterium]